MSPEVIDALVRLVANGRKFGVTDAVVIEHLLEMGVPKDHAQDLLKEITYGLIDGAGQYLGEQGPERNSPLYLAAFAAGQQTIADERKAQRPRQVVIVVIVLMVIGLLFFIFSR